MTKVFLIISNVTSTSCLSGVELTLINVDEVEHLNRDDLNIQSYVLVNEFGKIVSTDYSHASSQNLNRGRKVIWPHKMGMS